MLYVDLQANVGDFLGRADLYGQIPTFIALTEAKMSRRLRVRNMIANSTASISAEYETVPGDFAGPISLVLNPSENGSFPYDVRNVSPDALNEDLGRQGGVAGQPRKYAVVGGSFHFSPAPDQTYTAFLNYYQQLQALSGMNTSNWVLSNHPDAYLYGTLETAGLYGAATGKPDGRTGAWSSMFEAALQEIEQADLKESFGARLEPSVYTVV